MGNFDFRHQNFYLLYFLISKFEISDLHLVENDNHIDIVLKIKNFDYEIKNFDFETKDFDFSNLKLNKRKK